MRLNLTHAMVAEPFTADEVEYLLEQKGKLRWPLQPSCNKQI